MIWRNILIASILIIQFSAGESRADDDVPTLETLQAYFEFERVAAVDPTRSLAIADDMLAMSDTPHLRLAAARLALKAGANARAIGYLDPLTERLAPTDPDLTKALDMLAIAHRNLGSEHTALTYSLRAYNSAESRLGRENPALLERLAKLEPEVSKLMPGLLGPLREMRAVIEAERQNPSVRAIGDPEAITIWYGTNRNSTDDLDPANRYGFALGPLAVGRLTVTIPPTHLSGLIERPGSWFFNNHLDPDKHVVLANIAELTAAAFARGCCGADDRLLFIHGYNVSFHDGALRAAQLSFDLEFDGATMYYSWPSNASTAAYLVDANRVIASRPALVEFLEMATRGKGKLHIVAHSMGSRYALMALDTFVREFPERRLGKLVLAAPDVDRYELAALFPAITAKTDSVSLYASAKDHALMVSAKVNGALRAGDANGELFLINGMDSIDASEIEADMLGHSYFGDSPKLLADILGSIRLDQEPKARCSVKPREADAAQKYSWDVRTDGCSVEQLRAAHAIIRKHGSDALGVSQRLSDTASGEEYKYWLGVLGILKEWLEE